MKYHSKEDYDRLAVQIPKQNRDAYKIQLAELLLDFLPKAQASVKDSKLSRADKISVVKLSAEEKKLLREKERLLKAFVKLPKESRTIVLKLVEDFAEKLSSVKNI